MRPSKADFVEVEVCMLRADVMEDAGNRATHTRIKPFNPIGMNTAAILFML